MDEVPRDGIIFGQGSRPDRDKIRRALTIFSKRIGKMRPTSPLPAPVEGRPVKILAGRAPRRQAA